MLEIQKFIKANPNDWREKLAQPPYCISVKEDENYALLKYSQIDSDFNEPICRECRGIIIDKNDISVAALSFYKFFNVQEQFADTIYWKDCKVQEKVDGSKILVWYDKYNYQWRVSTSGTLDAYAATASDFHTFGDLFEKAVEGCGETLEDFYCYLSCFYCYTFELVSPETKIVVPYEKTSIYLIGVRDLSTLEEIDPTETYIAKQGIVDLPNTYALNSLKACLNAVEHMGYDEEGFVVVDKHWHRVKIKSPAYVIAHHMSNNSVVSKEKILEVIERGETSEFLGYFPEYQEHFDKVAKAREDFMSWLRYGVEIAEGLKHDMVDRKTCAERFNEKFKDISTFLFKFLDTDLLDLFIEYQWNRLSPEKKIQYLELQEKE